MSEYTTTNTSFADVESATLYVDTSGTPDMERFIAETSAIAERKAIAAGQEHPLPANLLFTIVGGNELGLFRIENERTGTVVFGTQLVETIVTLAGTSVDTSTDDSTLIEDVANFSNPSDNSTSTEPEPSEDTPSSGLETTEELNELISPGSEFAAQNPEAAASIETIRTNPTSTHSLTIAFVFSDSQESQRGTAYEYISSFSSREVALEMLSESGLTTVGTNLRITAASQVEFQENLAYNLAININNSTVNPEVQLPTALPAVYASCATTVGQWTGGLDTPLVGTSLPPGISSAPTGLGRNDLPTYGTYESRAARPGLQPPSGQFEGETLISLTPLWFLERYRAGRGTGLQSRGTAQFGGVRGIPGNRRVHWGEDIYVPSGTSMYAPWDGEVHAISNASSDRDYQKMFKYRPADPRNPNLTFIHVSGEVPASGQHRKGDFLGLSYVADLNDTRNATRLPRQLDKFPGGDPSHLHLEASVSEMAANRRRGRGNISPFTVMDVSKIFYPDVDVVQGPLQQV